MTNITKPVCGVRKPICRGTNMTDFVECYLPAGHEHEKHHEGRWGIFTVAWPIKEKDEQDLHNVPRGD